MKPYLLFQQDSVEVLFQLRQAIAVVNIHLDYGNFGFIMFFYHLGREIFDKVLEDFGFAFIHGVGLCTIEVHVRFARLKVPAMSFDTGEKKQGKNASWMARHSKFTQSFTYKSNVSFFTYLLTQLQLN